MYTVLSNAMPWLFNVTSPSPLTTQNSGFPFAPTDGTVPCVVPLNGTPAGSQITITYISGLVNGHTPAGNGITAPSSSPLSNVPYFQQQLVGAWTDLSGNVVSTVNLQTVGSVTLTVPVGATQLQLGVNWGGGASFNSGSGGYWVLGISGISPGGGPPGTNVGKLIMNELQIVSYSPLTTSGGLVDESHRLHYGEGPHGLGGKETTSFHSMLKQRGTAEIAVNVPAGDSWLPQKGWQVFLYDVTAIDQDPVFSGTIETIQTSWWGSNGDRLISISCTSYEQCLDVIRVYPGRLYQNVSAGYIFSDLLSLASGSPIVPGSITAGPIVDTFLVDGFPTIADCFDKLCKLESVQYVWTVDPGTHAINFGPPGVTPAPFTVQMQDVLFEAFDIQSTRTDFRAREIITIDADAFGRSAQLFIGQNQTSFVLQHPVKAVTNAWITNNTQNTATGTLSGIPSAGDSVSTSYPSSGSIYNWAANSQYAVDQIIIDPNGHTQKVTTSVAIGNTYGLSGMSRPSWNSSGGVTVDNQLRWTDQGVLPFGPYQVGVYTFVDRLDNTAWGQVLINPASLAITIQNLIDAINCQDTYTGLVSSSPYATQLMGRGYGFSYPTWENPLVSADAPTGGTFTLRNKYAGKGFVCALSASSAVFAWSAAQTSGGKTTFGTQSLSVGPATAQVQGLSYTPGSQVVTLFSQLNATIGSGVATNLQVEYHRLDGDAVIVENTPLVEVRAAIEAGTGAYHALTSDNAANTAQALAEANNALASYEVFPETLEFQTLRPGIKINQVLNFGFNMPYGPELESPESSSNSSVTAHVKINHLKCGGADSTGFTVLFTGTYAQLRTVANGGLVTNSSGYDIVFTSDQQGLNQLTWEVEQYNPSTGFIIAWVLIPTLSASADTQFYIQIGNSSISSFQGGATGAAWDMYETVLHFENGTTLSLADSSGNGNTATVSSGTVTATTGVVDGGAQLGSGDITVPGALSASQGSIEVWALISFVSGTVSLIGTYVFMFTPPQIPVLYAYGIGIHSVGWQFGSFDRNPGGIWNPIVWELFQISWSQAQNVVNLYQNGVLLDTQPYSTPGSLTSIVLGGTANPWNGKIDEFRTSTVARDINWNIARYNNESSPSTFYSVSFGAQWVVQEVEADLIPTNTNLGGNGLGNYGQMRYTVRCVNLAQIGSFLDFWEGLGGGSGGSISGTGGSSVANYSGTPAAQANAYGTPLGGVNEQTTNYTIQQVDNGVLVVSNGSATFKLPATPPSTLWWCGVANVGPGNLTLNPNGCLINGSSGNLTISQNDGLFVYTDGTNYFTCGATAPNFADNETPSGAQNGSNATFTLAHTPNGAGSLILVINGIVQLQGTDYTISAATITLISSLPNSANNEWIKAWYRY